MAAISPGLGSRPLKRNKKPTQTTKAHRFEPFSRRIARLKIDPVHQIARKVGGTDSEQNLVSHFRQSLEHWSDLNLSTNFTEFSQKATSLCETLPQLLHHADTLASLLLEYIGKRDVLSLESLLSLLAHFAHDLGSRFEKYFSDSVSLVADVAATHSAPEVIEWSFTCLAWIFKFLSRLLVPDLRPLLGIMVPFMGKTHQKEYVTRFAAESMAYLLRRAAILYAKNKAPLQIAIEYLVQTLDDIQDDRDLALYQNSVMTLLAETIRGVDNNLHEDGLALIECLFIEVHSKHSQSTRAEDVLVGVWTNALHHTTAETAIPIVEYLQSKIQSNESVGDQATLQIAISLTFTTIGTRKASRIKDWPAFNQALIHLTQAAMPVQDLSVSSRKAIVTCMALCVCFSPLDGLLSVISTMSQLVVSDHFSQNGLLFFSLLNKLSPDRLSRFFIKSFQEFINKNWEAQEDSVLTALLDTQSMQDSQCEPLIKSTRISTHWKTHMIHKIQDAPRDYDSAVIASSYATVISMSVDLEDQCDQWLKLLGKIVEEACMAKTSISLSDPWLRFAFGKVLSAHNDLTKTSTKHDVKLSSDIMDQVLVLRTYPAFLDAFLQYLSFTDVKAAASEDQLFAVGTAMIDNLLLDDVPIKQSSVAILRLLRNSVSLPEDVLDMCSEILTTSYTLQSVRRLSMLVRNMANLWQLSEPGLDARKLIPYFLLGLMSPRSPQLQEDICQGLASICASSIGEILVTDVLNAWLRTDSISTDAEEDNAKPDLVRPHLSPFQCSSVEVYRNIVDSCFASIENPVQILRDVFEIHHRIASTNHASARSLAIRVFQAIPALAEKRSRQLVPLLLSSINFDNPSDWSPPSDSSATSVTLSAHEKVQDWSRRDRKALLELFAKFQNPKVLFRCSDVFDALLDVLSKGDPEMQKLALKVIFTWKDPSIRPYEDHLQNLTDDRRFREELTVFFHVDVESTIIDETHRKELLPVVLRLLYGQMINRSGSQSNRGGQEARRKLILRTLFRLEEKEIQHFLLIGCGPLTDFVTTSDNSITQHTLSFDVLSPSRQYGLLNMVESLLQTLQSDLAPFAEILQRTVMYCLIRASRRLDAPVDNAGNEEGYARRNRRVGIRCLELLFQHCQELDWAVWAPLLFTEIINPRLEKLPVETAQGVSGTLLLFSAWASQSRTSIFFNRYNQQLLQTLGDCLIVPSARDEVKVFIMKDVFVKLCQTILDSGLEERDDGSSVLAGHVDSLLAILDEVLRQNPSRAVQDAIILSLSALTNFATSTESSAKLLSPLTLILRQPSEKVSPQTKGRLLEALRNLLSRSGHKPTPETFKQLLETVSSLFNYFTDRPNRSLLVEVLARLAATEPLLQNSSDLCTDLNAYSTTRLDEVDYDKRLTAFTTLLEAGVSGYEPVQWGPILPNVIYFCRDEDDFAIRSNAVAVLKMFIQQSVSEDNDPAWETLRREVVYPALKKGLKASSESVRADHLAMLGTMVQYDRNWDEINNMSSLLANNDEEASFFNNALHIQQHRRLRALRRLESDVRNGIFSSTNITTVFLPLLEHFIFDMEDDQSDQTLAGQAVVAVGVCLEEVEWGQYRAILRRYKGYMSSKPEAEKIVIKLIGVATNSLYRSAPWMTERKLPQDQDPPTPPIEHVSRLSKTMPKQEKLYQELSADIIPSLTAFVHQKDESEMSLRIPIAISTVRLIKLLPEDRMSLLLPSVLLDVASILKSRVQESRDIARRTLSELSSILGPGFFGFILKELRTSLARGYQLHVLSYTVHSIMVSMTENIQPGDLDYCLPTLVAIIMEDIFGNVGQEKNAEDYISKMKEVKSSKSYDSMELLAKVSTVRRLVDLIRPIQALLLESLSMKQANQVDDLLRRLSIGLSRNPAGGSRDILMFCYEVIQEFYRQQTQDASKSDQQDRYTDRFLIDLRTIRQRQPQSSSSIFTYKLVRFALDLLRSILTKHTELMTAENVHGFVPVLGDAMVEGQEDVRMSAMRLLSAIIKLPIAELDDNALLYAMQAVRVIRDSTNTNAESSQAALKLVTAILRDRRKVQLRDTDIGYLLHRITPDLDQPDRQGITFNFVKAVMARKIMVTELYDLVERIGPMMVTNHTASTRDAARGVYVHFLLDYPQSKSRWSKQVKFLARNLDYEYPEGRQSVMEAIHVLLKKSGDEIAEQLVGSFFLPVLLIVSNDDSAHCRELAAALLGQLFLRGNTDQIKSFLASLRSWIAQSDKMTLVGAGMQAYKVFFEANLPGSRRELTFVCSRINDILQFDDGNADADSWEPLYHTLQVFAKLCEVFPDGMMSKDQALLWPQIYTMLEHSHPWVQHSAAKLIGTFFSDLGRANAQSGLQTIPLTNNQGLSLEAYDMIRILKSSLHIIRKAGTPEDLRKQSVRNIVFLGRCCHSNGLVIDTPANAYLGQDGEQQPPSGSDDEKSGENDEQIPAFQFIFKQIATTLRREPSALKAQLLSPKASALQLLAALIGLSSAEASGSIRQLGGNDSTLRMILLPLVHLTDPSLPSPRTPDQEFQTTYRDLITSATQVLDLLQTKLGSKTYVDEMSKVQRLVKQRRDERARKRKVERVTDPEKYGLEKRRKREGEKRRRKERAVEMRGKRRGY